MVDLDSKFKTSPIESVIFGNSGTTGREFVVYPNPSSDGIQIEWDANLIDQPTSLEFLMLRVNWCIHRKYLKIRIRNILISVILTLCQVFICCEY